MVTISRLARPRRTRKSRSFDNVSIACANASALSVGTRIALTPLRAISRHPGTSVAINGRPHAAASSKLFGNPSRRDGRIAICACAQTLRMSSTWPRRRRFGMSRQLSSTRSGIDAGLDGSGSPASSVLTAMPRCRQQFVRTHQRLRALVVQQASNKADSKRTRRFLHWSQNVGVDAGTGNQGDSLLGHAEIR